MRLEISRDQHMNRAIDQIWEAVEAAIDARMSPKDFTEWAESHWGDVLDEKKRHAARSFQDIRSAK